MVRPPVGGSQWVLVKLNVKSESEAATILPHTTDTHRVSWLRALPLVRQPANHNTVP